MIQKKLEDKSSCSSGFVSALVQSMLQILPEVMSNQFGNYLCQKIIEVSGDDEVSHIVQAILPRCVEISLNVHGTRVIQTLVEVLAQKCYTMRHHLNCLINEFRGSLLELATHAHGNHVI